MSQSSRRPFILRWCFVIAAELVALLLFLGPRVSDSLECESLEVGYRCDYVEHHRLSEERTELVSADIGSIEYVKFRPGKGPMVGRIDIFDRRGDPISVLEGDPEEVQDQHAMLEEFARAANEGQRPQPLRLEQSSGVYVVVASIFFALFGAFVAFGPMLGSVGEEATEPEPVSAPTPGSPDRSRAWRVPLVVVGIVVVLVAVSMVAENRARAHNAMVEVQCKHRCKIGGMDCRPPGVIVGPQPPGTFTVQVFDPDAPGGWTDLSIEVEAGERYVLVCEP